MKVSNYRRPVNEGIDHPLGVPFPGAERHVISPKTRQKTAGGSSEPHRPKRWDTAWQLEPCEIPQTYTGLKHIEIV